MDKTYNHQEKEREIYKLWEKVDAFSPMGEGDSYSVLMPPPNANAPLHCGHATYAIQDLMIRFKRMQGYSACYFPGTDHAGFETQVVYEKKLAQEGKSRFDFDRENFYNQVLEFVKENSDVAINQLKKLGISADWSKNTFMLDDKVIDTVYDTFIKMHKDGMVYRDGYMVNYSTFHGTTFSDLETVYKDSISPLYYVNYKFKNDETKQITVATVRPETIYADVAIAVNPDDSRYKELIGKIVLNPLNNCEMKIIADSYVDPEFGTGALKITPGHDFNDYEIGKRHNLEVISLINLNGKMNKNADECEGLFPKQARKKVIEILEKMGALEKIDESYENRILVDYKDGNPIEPMILPNWFIDMEKLSEMAIEAVKTEKVKFNRDIWKRDILKWLEAKKPWPISRQTVFGIRIPVWYSVKENPEMTVTFIKDGETFSGKIVDLMKLHDLSDIKKGLQKIVAAENAKYEISKKSPGDEFLQETDTFDTWFSSGQWPLTTTGYPDGKDFKKYFPTDFMDSMWDIMFFWIARMIMISLYLTGRDLGEAQVPFKNVYFHGMVTDEKGQKMSKSKANVIDPIEMAEKYGADALRMSLLVGGNTAAKVSPFDEDKVRGYRNFANKIWNIGRFINMKREDLDNDSASTSELPHEEDSKLNDDLNRLVVSVTEKLDAYEFKLAGEEIYHFVWERLANDYLEKIKDRKDSAAISTLTNAFLTSLKLLHPYMPFITEAVWQEMEKPEKEKEESEYLITADWPA